MKLRNTTPWAKRVTGAAFALGASAALFGAQGCLDRPVAPIIPNSSGVKATKIRAQKVDKIDLLFVVDNSISMADKQSELGKRIPDLIFALTDDTPDPDTGDKNNAIDIHVGVISSSLGSQGTSACDPGITNPSNNDKGHLLPRTGEGTTGTGYTTTAVGAEPTATPCPGGIATSSALTWTYAETGAGATGQFKGKSGATDLQAASSCVVQSANQNGCGYEETWESAYHFLVDPKPYATAAVKCTFTASGDACGSNKIEVAGVDDQILNERKAFLREDSLLAVVVLSDENDASLKPAGLNWLPWGYGKGQMQRGWTNCSMVPDDFEPETPAEFNTLHSMYNCKSCFEDGSDPNCKKPWATDPLNNDTDDRNMRAFNQTQRFGYNFLWGRQRYVNAFSNAQAVASDGSIGVNPIFAGGKRTKDLVIVAGIVGVPKVLVSDGEVPKDPLTEADWKKIIGPIGERDPHMIESIGPRAGIPKFAGDRSIDAVNGGDRDVTGDDLQYACIAERAVTTKSNDCEAPDSEKKNPLCDAGAQPYFKAFPGLRHLRIIHDLGASGFVASICNKTYAPAVAGISKKLKAALNAQCIQSEITVKDGKATCLILESISDSLTAGEYNGKSCEQIAKGLCTPGTAPCRVDGTDYPPVPLDQAAGQLSLPITVVNPTTGLAGNETVTATVDGSNVVAIGSDGKKHIVCEMLQLTAPDPNATSCQNDKKFKLDATTQGGWCYSTNPAVLSKGCNLGTIRFGGGAQPRNGSEVFTLCLSGG
jgi:hypothetical protein